MARSKQGPRTAPTTRRSLPAGALPADERVAIKRAVSFSWSDVEGLRGGHLLNLSNTGMFVETRDQQPAGTVLTFEFSLGEGGRPVRGQAEVVWNRRDDESLPSRPPGMDLRFLDLGASSRRQIRRKVARLLSTVCVPGQSGADRPSTSGLALADRAPADRARQRSSTRVPVARPIELRFDDSAAVVTGLCEDVSIGGMFVQLEEPGARGSLARFELRLDGGDVLRGQGEVVWNRAGETGRGRKAGSGIKFRHLGEKDQQLIRKIVRQHTRRLAGEGRPAPSVGAGRSPAPEVDAAAAETAVGLGPAAEPVTSEVYRRSWSAGEAEANDSWWNRRFGFRLPLVALTVCSFLLLFGIMSSKPRSMVSAMTAPVSTPSAAGEEPVPTPAPAKVAAAEPAAEVVDQANAAEQGDVEREIINLARAWAKAWSDQRFDDYLGFYAADFQSPRRLDRSAWEDLRRSRITKPRYIEVTLSAFEPVSVSGWRARVSFEQTYRSDSYRDTVRKSLELVREGGGWKILAESLEKSDPG